MIFVWGFFRSIDWKEESVSFANFVDKETSLGSQVLSLSVRRKGKEKKMSEGLVGGVDFKEKNNQPLLYLVTHGSGVHAVWRKYAVTVQTRWTFSNELQFGDSSNSIWYIGGVARLEIFPNLRMIRFNAFIVPFVYAPRVPKQNYKKPFAIFDQYDPGGFILDQQNWNSHISLHGMLQSIHNFVIFLRWIFERYKNLSPSALCDWSRRLEMYGQLFNSNFKDRIFPWCSETNA